jgi:hypothetical protein
LVVEFAAVVGSGPRGRTQQIQIKGDNTREVSREQHSHKSQPRYFWAPPVAFLLEITPTGNPSLLIAYLLLKASRKLLESDETVAV